MATGYKGVVEHDDGTYGAQVVVDGRAIDAGSYDTPVAAARAHDIVMLHFVDEDDETQLNFKSSHVDGCPSDCAGWNGDDCDCGLMGAYECIAKLLEGDDE